MLTIFLMLFGITSSVVSFAGCPSSGKGECGTEKKCEKSSECDGQCPILSKLLKKADFFLDNQTEIGLSDEQVKQIKDLQLWGKKQAIMGEAGMKTMALEVKSKLSEKKIDVDALNAMIDQGMAEWGKSAKETLNNYVKLKAILSEEQMEKAKAVWMKKN